MNTLSYIFDRIGQPAALEQLAEEATELAQAALKYARKIRDDNPTPVDIYTLEANLKEEFTDVMLASDILGLRIIASVYAFKIERWVDRIQNRPIRTDNPDYSGEKKETEYKPEEG